MKDFISYIGTKLIEALVMTLGEYNDQRGWVIPEGEDPNTEGYMIRYPDGYLSWSPKAQFEEAYREAGGINFGLAFEAMRKGFKVARKGWNGNNMFLIMVAGSEHTPLSDGTPYDKALNTGSAGQSHVNINPHIDMFTANGDFQPGWLASQTDMFADDWFIIKEEDVVKKVA